MTTNNAKFIGVRRDTREQQLKNQQKTTIFAGFCQFFSHCFRVPRRAPMKFTSFVDIPGPVNLIKFQPNRHTGGWAIGRAVGQPGQKLSSASIWKSKIELQMYQLFAYYPDQLPMSVISQKKPTTLGNHHVKGFHDQSTQARGKWGVKCHTNFWTPCILRKIISL